MRLHSKKIWFVQLKKKELKLISSCVVILISSHANFHHPASETKQKKSYSNDKWLTRGSVNLNSSFVGCLFSCCLWISRISALTELADDDGTFHSKGFSFVLRLELFICTIKTLTNLQTLWSVCWVLISLRCDNKSSRELNFAITLTVLTDFHIRKTHHCFRHYLPLSHVISGR